MSANKKLTMRYISSKTYSAILATKNGQFYKCEFPYRKLTPASKVETPPISKSFDESLLHKKLFPRIMLIALSEANDIFIKINNGSVDILDDEHYKELMLEKIKNNLFLLQGKGMSTLVQWLSTSFLFIKYERSDIQDIVSVIEDAGKNPSFVINLYKRFGRINKTSLVNKLIDETLDEMKDEGKWAAYRKATFVLFFMSKCYDRSRASETKEEYEDAIESFERNTGIDANYNPIQRHTDRFTRNQHFNSKKRKKIINKK